MQFMAEEPNTVHGCKHVIIMVRKASSRRRLVLLRCGGRHRRARAGNRSGREGNRRGGREIVGQVEKSTARSSIWPFGERENERRKGNERTWSSRRRRLLRASAVRGASATPLRLPRRERESSAPSSARARPRPPALRLRRPPAPPSSSLARRLLPPPSSCLCICVGPQAPPSSCLCICCLAHAFMLLSC